MSKKQTGPVLGAVPRVELLPPAVREREKAQQTKRLVGLSIVLALAVVAAGYSLGYLRLVTAQNELLAAQNRTQELLLEQQQYAEASAAAGQVRIVEDARSLVSSTEIAWDGVMAQVAAALPGGSTIVDATMTGTAPWASAPLVESPLRALYVAKVDLTVSLPSLPDAAELQRSLSAVTGYADSAISSVSRGEGGGYTAVINLTLTAEAYSGRFVDEEAQAATDTAEDAATGELETTEVDQ